ncbi:MAG: response regulator [Burkholderiaceae bacterium]|jgi:two-component system cell cycle response regulator
MGAHILVIEDNLINLELMRYLLETFKYRVSVASNGEEGIEAARRESPDLILCDVQMPGIDGYEVVRRLRSDTAFDPIPVVAVTAYAMVGDQARAQAVFDGYIAKPIDPASFIQNMEAFLKPENRNRVRPTQAKDSAPASKSGRSGRVILALDNLQVNLDLATTIFESAGYTVIATSDMKQALDLARKHAPDLILSDVSMPVGSGFEFLKEIKADATLCETPFVFLTSTAMNEADRKRGLALGATKYLFRPLEPSLLLAEVEDCLA